MPTFRYDLPEMTDFVDLLDRSIEEATTHLQTARSTVSTVLEEYSGAAATAFTADHDRWQAQAEEHLSALRQYRAYVSTARDNYAEALRANVEMFG
ncbi:MAG: WXG100 family type VII secretion target [Mycobacterium kyogaense]|uniref:WXG100 family type VII secretion target n=1 Tax=Mycobacterium kyogaense TaxID=2212479 RepID=UPI002FFC4682